MPARSGRSDAEGELDGRPEEAQEEQGQPLEQEEPEARVEAAPDYKALLDKQDERVRELESQVAEPWLFEDGPAGGTRGLEPAGASGGDDGELRRWRGIAGLEDGN